MIRVTRTERKPKELYQLALMTADQEYACRLRALAMVMDGCSRGLAARAQGVDTTTVARWIRRYNAEGLEGVLGRRRGGSGSSSP